MLPGVKYFDIVERHESIFIGIIIERDISRTLIAFNLDEILEVVQFR